MAAGCVVVGYTGLGGREYFTENTGFPVAEDDTAALVRALEAAVTEYEQNPTRLDALRRHASEVINARYSRQNFEASLLRIWERLTATKGTV
jgi:glycosyltransferase involved in cell wall biosynthesis